MLSRAGIVVLAIAIACSDDPSGPCTECPPPGLMVSDPISAPVFAANGESGASALVLDGRTAYVSLPPGTVAGGSRAEISRVSEIESVVTTVIDGGFDPVPIAAQVGDSLDVIVRSSGDAIVFQSRVAVTATRAPRVVRTQPPRRKTQVALNAAILAYFSEPMDPSSVTTTTIRLMRGTMAVQGTVRFTDATRLTVEFVPTAQLLPETDYELRLAANVRDLSGSPLTSALSIPFTTGTSLAGAAASVHLTVDSIHLPRGATYPLSATVRDASGTVLTGQSVVWASSDPAGLAVSGSGLLTAQRVGYYNVTATVGELSHSIPVAVPVPDAESVVVFPAEESAPAGIATTLQATVRDGTGRVIDSPAVTWTSSNDAYATVVSVAVPPESALFARARVTGWSPGVVTIRAVSGSASGTATITVTAPAPVASVSIDPGSAALLAGATARFTATLRDAAGRLIFGRSATWSSDDIAVATIADDGVVTAVGRGSASVRATSEGISSNIATVTVTTIDLVAVSAGFRYSCGLAADGVSYCWGDNRRLQLGSSGGGSLVPAPVSGGLSFSSVNAGEGSLEYLDENPHTCGLRSDGSAYCWGSNLYGEVGVSWNGFYATAQPQPVVGGLSFDAISVGAWHTCAIATGGAAYCWGWLYGQTATNGWDPVPVATSHLFTAVNAGSWTTCGVTSTAAVYCWDQNPPITPSLVPGGHSFRTVSVGEDHACGVTTGGRAYCWGWNGFGQLGNGSTSETRVTIPVAVAGGLTFRDVSAGEFYSCGVTTAGSAMCWGSNDSGRLGNGSTTSSATPVAVSGGHSFAAASAGHSHTCGLTAAGITYCWGSNSHGQLGTGTVASSLVPIKIRGQP